MFDDHARDEDTVVNLNTSEVRLTFEQLYAAQLIDDAEYGCEHGLEMFLRKRRDLTFALQMTIRTCVAQQTLDVQDLEVPADWRSHFWMAVRNWAERKKHTAGRYDAITLRWLARKAHERIRWTRHRFESKRIWPDVLFDGHRTKVMHFWDGSPIAPGPDDTGRAMEAFQRAKFAVLSSMGTAYTAPEQPDQLVDELLDRASYVDWRKVRRR